MCDTGWIRMHPMRTVTFHKGVLSVPFFTTKTMRIPSASRHPRDLFQPKQINTNISTVDLTALTAYSIRPNNSGTPHSWACSIRQWFSHVCGFRGPVGWPCRSAANCFQCGPKNWNRIDFGPWRVFVVMCWCVRFRWTEVGLEGTSNLKRIFSFMFFWQVSLLFGLFMRRTRN